MEYKLVYNIKGKKFYLYHGENLLCDFEKGEKAIKEFKQLIEESDQDLSHGDIRDKFGWEPIKKEN